MGGLAFASGPEPLYTPRMPPEIYQLVRDHCHSILQQLFICVATPIEGPGKEDYGDIDIFLAWERKEIFPSKPVDDSLKGLPEEPLQAAARLLKAEKTRKEQPHSLTLAIPWPEGQQDSAKQKDPAGSQANGCNGQVKEDTKRRFIQVDLHYYQSIDRLQWMLFKHAHGDLWSILGSTIRPFGLTIDGVGLYLRIPEIEKEDRKKAKVLLTEDPAAVLDFLGLKFDSRQWEERFAHFTDVFEYAATSRFFRVGRSQSTDEDGIDCEEQMKSETDMKKLKSNDRRRMNQRPLFRKWVEEFLQKCREEGRFGNTQLTRDDVRHQVFARFRVRCEYEARLFEWRMQRQKETLWKNVIKPSLPGDLHPMWRGCAASALKKIIMQDDDSFGVRPQRNLRDESGLFIEEYVRDFARGSWKQVGDVAWRKNQERYLEHLNSKGTKRTVSGVEKGQ
ncbi:hypothetical protein DL766_007952 [Monosporascus sp. MC13-8B]|uniref:RNA-directed RNA polymerase n=1 Tax=Monosporascus cannonballus TaxID=155416 RepID=A0ABY0H1J4_9PEZI|nr:hypothetical protein DL762_006615 [Monosporascus cannonballus]RYO93454.1 hypothetical protein DL763_004357 [Monosporascus cannonballus]RYP21414.1 hypothetical protein DL766_007952 [Monosporascus sp. MC13-8B]